MSKILIVDDNDGVYDSLAMALRMEGYTVNCAANGTEMRAQVKTFNPDLILLDMLISGEDGCDLCRDLKKKKSYESLPVVIMSAHPDGNARALACGADGFLPKPFSLDDLFATVKKFAKTPD